MSIIVLQPQVSLAPFVILILTKHPIPRYSAALKTMLTQQLGRNARLTGGLFPVIFSTITTPSRLSCFPSMCSHHGHPSLHFRWCLARLTGSLLHQLCIYVKSLITIIKNFEHPSPCLRSIGRLAVGATHDWPSPCALPLIVILLAPAHGSACVLLSAKRTT